MAVKTEPEATVDFGAHVKEQKRAKVTPIRQTVSVDDLREGESTVDVFGDGSLAVTYTLDGITPKLLREARSFADSGANAGDVETVGFCVEFVSKVVTKWDLLGSNKEVVPLTVEAIDDEVPIKLLLKVMYAIMGHLVPGNGSAGGSSPSFSGNPKRRPRTGTR